MSIITRSEASHRLKIISALASRSAGAARDGEWRESAEAAASALRLLETILPHLEEADNLEPQKRGSATYNPPVIGKVGGMGYRGSSNGAAKQRPKPIPRPAIITPPPVVTGLGNTIKGVVPEPIKVEVPVVLMSFDLKKIDGTPEFQIWQQEAYQTGEPSMRTDEELTAATKFWDLPLELQERIAAKYREIGGPVVLRMRQK